MAPLGPSKLRAINVIETLQEERRERLGEDEDEREEEAPEEAADWCVIFHPFPSRVSFVPLGVSSLNKKACAFFIVVQAGGAHQGVVLASGRGERKEKERGRKRSPGLPCAPSPRLSSSAASGQPFPPLPLVPFGRPPRRSSSSSVVAAISSSACVIVAFACAGSAEDLWSSEGTGIRRAPSPLLWWLSLNRGRMLSVQLPGRGARRKEPFAESAAAVAREVVSLVAAEILVSEEEKEKGERGRFWQIPWFVAGHSMGAWLAFELVSAARDAGLHPPKRLLLSAMPPPHTPGAERPWRGPAASLPTTDLVAGCRAWGISEAVFHPGVWEEYEPLLRNDFRLFDEYRFERGGERGRKI